MKKPEMGAPVYESSKYEHLTEVRTEHSRSINGIGSQVVWFWILILILILNQIPSEYCGWWIFKGIAAVFVADFNYNVILIVEIPFAALFKKWRF
jgi:hypothetical protein